MQYEYSGREWFSHKKGNQLHSERSQSSYTPVILHDERLGATAATFNFIKRPRNDLQVWPSTAFKYPSGQINDLRELVQVHGKCSSMAVKCWGWLHRVDTKQAKCDLEGSIYVSSGEGQLEAIWERLWRQKMCNLLNVLYLRALVDLFSPSPTECLVGKRGSRNSPEFIVLAFRIAFFLNIEDR